MYFNFTYLYHSKKTFYVLAENNNNAESPCCSLNQELSIVSPINNSKYLSSFIFIIICLLKSASLLVKVITVAESPCHVSNYRVPGIYPLNNCKYHYMLCTVML